MVRLIGRKCGMTRVMTPDGISIPVTVIEVLPNRVTQIRKNGDVFAVQVTTGAVKRSRLTKPLIGHYAKANVEPGRGLWEFSVDVLDGLEEGKEFTVDSFKEGQLVDVTSVSKGKGFAGTIKRHHFASQDATHGNSLSHRAPGSIGQRQSPGKVFKGKKMSGHMGHVKCTILSQKVVGVNSERHYLFVKGGVPGAPGSDVIIRSAIKNHKKVEGIH